MTDIDRFYKYHGGKPEEEPYENLSEDEAKMLAKYYYEEVTIEDYRTLYDAYRKIKSEKNKYFNSYLEASKTAKDYKYALQRSRSNFRFLFLFAFLSAMIAVVYLEPYLNFSAIIWRGAISAVVGSFIGFFFKFIHDESNPERQTKIYFISYVAAIIFVWIISNRIY